MCKTPTILSLLLASILTPVSGTAFASQPSGQAGEARTGWFYCSVGHTNIMNSGPGEWYYTEPFRASTDQFIPVFDRYNPAKIRHYTFPEPEAEKFIDYVEAMSGLSPRADFQEAVCRFSENEHTVRDLLAITDMGEYYNHLFNMPMDLLPNKHWKQAVKSGDSPKAEPVKKEATKSAPEAPPAQPVDKTREQYEAEYQAKMAAHQKLVDEHRRKVAEREAEIERQNAQQAALRDTAAKAQAAHEAELAAHRLQLEAANRRQEEYEAAKRRHLECLSWNKQACDDIVAGKPAFVPSEEQQASTDTDPNVCVTSPEIRLNATFQGNTSASVMNGCGQPVDIRICLKRNADWNCGVTSGVSSQGRAVHSSFEATGEVFVDARTTGNPRSFADPPN